MKRSSILFSMILGIFFATGADLAVATGLEVGIATTDITPPIPYRMSGYFHERVSTGTHDPLLAKAIVFKQGDVSAVLVFCDLIGIQGYVSDAARQQASQKTGIPKDHIVIAATHSHTGPLYVGEIRDFLHQRQITEKGTDPLEKIDYPADLIQKIVAAIEKANASLQPVDLQAGTAEETTLAFNRRFHMKKGPVRFNPGLMNPNIIRPAGPIDPEVGLLLFRSQATRKPFGALTVFALHLDTTGGTEYSADYPYYLAEGLKQAFGSDFVSAFGIGTCGDINHHDVTTKKRRRASDIGKKLAETVAPALAELPPVLKPSLAVASGKVVWPLQTYTEEELAESKSLMPKVVDRQGGLPFLERVKACTVIDLSIRGTKDIALEVQAIRLGPDVAIVALPGEIFVDLGLAIKKNSPFETTMVVELANQCPGYIPTKKAFSEGSYETVNSRIQPGGGEKLVEEATKLLKQLKP